MTPGVLPFATNVRFISPTYSGKTLALLVHSQCLLIREIVTQQF